MHVSTDNVKFIHELTLLNLPLLQLMAVQLEIMKIFQMVQTTGNGDVKEGVEELQLSVLLLSLLQQMDNVRRTHEVIFLNRQRTQLMVAQLEIMKMIQILAWIGSGYVRERIDEFQMFVVVKKDDINLPIEIN